MARDSVTIEHLSRLAGVSASRLARELQTAGHVSGGGKYRLVRNPGSPKLRRLLERIRHDEAQRRMATRTSRLWVAGYPHLVAQWDRERNVDLFPDEVRYGAKRKIWWRCAEGPDHLWLATPNTRTSKKTGCPFCAGKKASVTNSLLTLAPRLAGQWHPRNGPLTPDRITSRAQRHVWWKCPVADDHEWRASVDGRKRDASDCPFCAGRRVSRTNSLATIAPDVAAQWHERNRASPDKVLAHTNTSYWWRCPVSSDHVWRAVVSDRTGTRPTGCPFCAGKAASETNSIAAREPDLARQWHPSRNGRRRPTDVAAGSRTPAWWKCPNGPDHEWRVSPSSRTWHESGCPFCAGKRLSVTNSLASRHPELARQYDDRRNRGTADAVLAGSKARCWWRCPEAADHVWEASPADRSKAPGCPFCAGRRVSRANALATVRPDLAKEWHPTRNATLLPTDVVAGSGKTVWWRCRRNPRHVWQARIAARSKPKGTGCPTCARQKAR
jgi:hypothetical protein